MAKGRFLNQKLGKRTSYRQRQAQEKLAVIPGGARKRRGIIDATERRGSEKDRGK